ncbi:MAG: archease [Nitrosopumilus sp.]|nr:archease [Nitrosopumilus sp.]CAI9830751.1 conserved hypothetical protein [Nitrosopumilaceae archaeon]MDA7941961.1 archease [Nitrosopumilus sp.]MDA7943914.1 archease [Nitrosopumilus sp.]MDA7945272.1 archease [Nitrosopumilus sp.]
MTYRLLDHATDAEVEVDAPDAGSAFADAAAAVAGIMLAGGVAEKESRDISAAGSSPEMLLYGWLEEVIFLVVTEGFAVSRIEARVSGGRAEGTARGEPLDVARHGFGTEIKAPTLHGMEVRLGTPSYMRFILDL